MKKSPTILCHHQEMLWLNQVRKVDMLVSGNEAAQIHLKCNIFQSMLSRYSTVSLKYD